MWLLPSGNPRVIGLVSTYQDGELAVSAVRSLLAACTTVHVAVGPIGVAGDPLPEFDTIVESAPLPGVVVFSSAWDSDAGKRTVLLEHAKALTLRARRSPPRWGVVLDGDELLVNGAELAPLVAHADEVERVTGEKQYGVALRIVEADGSCSRIPARVLRLDRIVRYLVSSYHLELEGGVEVSMPNVPLVLAGEPDSARLVAGMQARRPLPGEPCILHRSHLRSPARTARRQNVAEAEAFAELDRLGLRHESPHVPANAPRLWLPQ